MTLAYIYIMTYLKNNPHRQRPLKLPDSPENNKSPKPQDKDIWVKRFAEDTKIVQLTREKLGLPAIGLVCDDCRFENEHLALKANGWVGIFLAVSDEIRESRLQKIDGDAQVSTLNHASEVSVDVFKDELIQIDASQKLEDTYKQLDKLIEEIKNGQTV